MIIPAAVLALAVLSIVSFGIIENYLMHEWGKFRDCSADKMVVYLENRYNIDFPENIKDVKAAKTWRSWDGGANFILRFTAEANDVARFLESIPQKRYTLGAYLPGEDDRFIHASSVPKWYLDKIDEGKIGSLHLSVAYIKNVGFPTKIYIDTANAKSHVVYMKGNYKHDVELEVLERWLLRQ